MIGLELSPDNKFAAAYTNNNQTILLNTLISEFFIIDNPLGKTYCSFIVTKLCFWDNLCYKRAFTNTIPNLKCLVGYFVSLYCFHHF